MIYKWILHDSYTDDEVTAKRCQVRMDGRVPTELREIKGFVDRSPNFSVT